ncbi:Nitrite reductase [bacterium HR40]|nr:Nitrite reductase [bacterium HR40]
MSRCRVGWWLAAAVATASAQAASDPVTLYATHCASCHGADRLGGQGPALLPEAYGRLDVAEAAEVIASGRPATRMPGFRSVLAPEEIASLAAYIFTPPSTPPRFTARDIEASRRILVADEALPERPLFDADPLDLFVLVEAGDHHISILDGDGFVRLARLATHRALHGGPKFSSDGRFVWTASRDGWIERFDLWSLAKLGEVRAGIHTRNIAVSADGRILAVANWLPRTLVLLDARTLAPLDVRDIRGAGGEATSRASAVYSAPPRQSFVLALKDVPEIWEIAWADPAPRRFSGFGHSYEKGMEEVLPPLGRFPVRRIDLATPLEDFFFDPSYRLLVGAARDGSRAVVVHLDLGQPIAEIPLPGMPHLGAGIAFTSRGRRLLAIPHLKEAALSIVDLETFAVVERIPTLGPGFFVRSHENSPHIWVDALLGAQRDAVQVIDKESLEIVATLRPLPGKTAGHVEFDREGRHVLLSIQEDEGAVVVIDDRSLAEVARLPARRPSGKYNVWNKTRLSEGTSH